MTPKAQLLVVADFLNVTSILSSARVKYTVWGKFILFILYYYLISVFFGETGGNLLDTQISLSNISGKG